MWVRLSQLVWRTEIANERTRGWRSVLAALRLMHVAMSNAASDYLRALP